MKCSFMTLFITFYLVTFKALAVEPFKKGWQLQNGKPNSNPYLYSEDELKLSVARGREYLSRYPVQSTKLLLPRDLLNDMFEHESRTRPLLDFIFKNLKLSPWASRDEFYTWLGLSRDDHTTQIPTDDGFFGVTVASSASTEAITFGCGSCHISTLFGQTIVGLSTRFPRANSLFVTSGQIMNLSQIDVLNALVSASPGEAQILKGDHFASKNIGAKTPSSLGLDTSLAQVGLSLNKRNKDETASFNAMKASFPPHHYLMDHRADSKPAVWWNIKYKTKWLSDGSLEGGNPVYTNFLWNEIGRGADLTQLEMWMRQNESLSKDMVNALLHISPPKMVHFLGAKAISLDAAKKGEVLFNRHCAVCHGTYEKAWSRESSEHNLFDTISVTYHSSTPVIDVGTDPLRYKGMSSFSEDLNRLSISKFMGTEVIPKVGYVPPPLDGIWSRFPYMHNNSIPSLCEVLTASRFRVKVYKAIEPKNIDLDFDSECVGYPRSVSSEAIVRGSFQTSKPGQSNAGHDEGIFLKDGKEILSMAEKKQLIEFMKSL